jgi:hypothetical protein
VDELTYSATAANGQLDGHPVEEKSEDQRAERERDEHGNHEGEMKKGLLRKLHLSKV